ncbi:MAG: hypothetical protein HY306_13125 [Nitrosomonadales bacterium]|nr:hypothetical protein [Nitrosomonadales bacterium]
MDVWQTLHLVADGYAVAAWLIVALANVWLVYAVVWQLSHCPIPFLAIAAPGVLDGMCDEVNTFPCPPVMWQPELAQLPVAVVTPAALRSWPPVAPKKVVVVWQLAQLEFEAA